MEKTSQIAKNLILSVVRKLVHQQTLEELETSFMKKWLARRRWFRAFNAFQATMMMRKLSSTEYKSLPESQIASAQQLNLRILESDTGTELPRDMAEFNAKYTELSQVGAGGFGSVHLFQDKETGELVAAKRLRQPKQLVRAEASVLFKLIKSTFIVKVCKQIPLNLSTISTMNFSS